MKKTEISGDTTVKLGFAFTVLSTVSGIFIAVGIMSARIEAQEKRLDKLDQVANDVNVIKGILQERERLQWK